MTPELLNKTIYWRLLALIFTIEHVDSFVNDAPDGEGVKIKRSGWLMFILNSKEKGSLLPSPYWINKTICWSQLVIIFGTEHVDTFINDFPRRGGCQNAEK